MESIEITSVACSQKINQKCTVWKQENYVLQEQELCHPMNQVTENCARLLAHIVTAPATKSCKT